VRAERISGSTTVLGPWPTRASAPVMRSPTARRRPGGRQPPRRTDRLGRRGEIRLV